MGRLLDFRKFFPSNVAAFVSDRTIDFKHKDDCLSLSLKQKKYLSCASGIKISLLPNIKQIHGRRIIVVKKPSCFGPRQPMKADGMMTKKTGIPLTVRTADCLSIFMFDPKKNAIALVHAGWRGSHSHIAGRAVVLMKKHFGTHPKDLKIAFGPSICGCCYEVGAEFKKFFPKETVLKGGKYFFDLALANKRQLVKAGVNPKNIFDPNICTFCNKQYFSHRREGAQAGRMISFMMLKDSK